MKAAATHQGTCQVCGRLQKLPAGVLAKHGYDVRFGFFNGTCWGTGHKPFEQAYDCVQQAITWATNTRNALQAAVTALEAEPVGSTAPFHRYVTAKTRYERSGYREEMVTVGLDDRGYTALQFADGKTEPGLRHGLHGSVEAVVLQLRAARIERYQKSIAEQQRYIDWQQRRIDTWKPGKLTPVVERAKAV